QRRAGGQVDLTAQGDHPNRAEVGEHHVEHHYPAPSRVGVPADENPSDVRRHTGSGSYNRTATPGRTTPTAAGWAARIGAPGSVLPCDFASTTDRWPGMADTTTVDRVGAGDHACLTFSNAEERLDLLAAFVRDGLRAGQKVVCWTD